MRAHAHIHPVIRFFFAATCVRVSFCCLLIVLLPSSIRRVSFPCRFSVCRGSNPIFSSSPPLPLSLSRRSIFVVCAMIFAAPCVIRMRRSHNTDSGCTAPRHVRMRRNAFLLSLRGIKKKKKNYNAKSINRNARATPLRTFLFSVSDRCSRVSLSLFLRTLPERHFREYSIFVRRERKE